MTSSATPMGLWERDPHRYWEGFTEALTTAGVDSPALVLDTSALEHNVADLLRRAGGVPIRLASKSLRVRSVITDLVARPGFAGVLAYDLDEARWLATESGITDVLMGYPTVRPSAIGEFLADEMATTRVTLLVDSVAHLDAIDAIAAPGSRPSVRVAIDLDASLRALGGRVHLGVRRSPIHDLDAALALGRSIVDRPGFDLVGVMSYEAQVAGVGDDVPGKRAKNGAVRLMQRASMAEIRRRRGRVVAALRDIAPLEIVNAGGTGSLEATSRDTSVTDIAAGSGVFGGHLFDTYRRFRPAPALAFGLDVVRVPAPGFVTCAGGGWIASGPPAPDRLPRPVWPRELHYVATEAAGEVQTPLHGPGTEDLRIGDRVWFRHTKSGEVCERSSRVARIARTADGTARVDELVPTYRGEGKCFL
ncbi:alanine racemase [Gordonia polyisoprenivorans]|uniref:alanine racemase n=1 Tax=Gordonia polyisoprenivorans TaxID=84595 RepID=UPI0003654DF3|nr:alanine racemase [Gordonia polyisoprenivorans]OZC31894.1 alanine racemase [Gordonia polyisoprenivorans]WCB36435.1 alanine racemase [Gordonia polyisoprenivorans]